MVAFKGQSLLVVAMLFAARPLHAQEARASKACSEPGLRYLYADSAKVIGKKVLIYGCRSITPDGKSAGECDKLAVVDTTKLKKAQEKAKENLFSWVSGLVAGTACSIGLHAGMYFNKPSGMAARVIDSRIAGATTANIRNSTNQGRRQPGDMPQREDVNKGVASSVCSTLKHIGNSNYQNGVAQGVGEVGALFAMPWAYKADAQWVRSPPTAEGRQARFKEWQRRLKENAEKQKFIIEKTSEAVGVIYKYLTTGDAVTIPFGTSRNIKGQLDPSYCITPEGLRHFFGLIQSFSKIVSKSEKNLFEFKPGQEIIRPIENEKLKKQLKNVLLNAQPIGVHEVVPGERVDSTFNGAP